MKRLVTSIAVVLSLVGCGPSGGSLLTGDPLRGSCFLATASGRLVVDPSYGTAIIPEGHRGMIDRRTIVAWRPGYTPRRSGSEVEVLDPQGRVVATTGRSYLIPGGYVDPVEFGRPDLPTMVWWACRDLGLLS